MPATEQRSRDRHRTRRAQRLTADAQPGRAPRMLARPTRSPTRRVAANAALLCGAGLVAASGLVHLYLWADGYRNVTTIGPLFLAQGIGGLVLALLLIAFPRVITAGAAAVYLIATAAALAVSATFGLVGFMDTVDAPWATTSLVVECAGAVVLLLGAALAVTRPDRRHAGTRTRSEHR